LAAQDEPVGLGVGVSEHAAAVLRLLEPFVHAHEETGREGDDVVHRPSVLPPRGEDLVEVVRLFELGVVRVEPGLLGLEGLDGLPQHLPVTEGGPLELPERMPDHRPVRGHDATGRLFERDGERLDHVRDDVDLLRTRAREEPVDAEGVQPVPEAGEHLSGGGRGLDGPVTGRCLHGVRHCGGVLEEFRVAEEGLDALVTALGHLHGPQSAAHVRPGGVRGGEEVGPDLALGEEGHLEFFDGLHTVLPKSVLGDSHTGGVIGDGFGHLAHHLLDVQDVEFLRPDFRGEVSDVTRVGRLEALDEPLGVLVAQLDHVADRTSGLQSDVLEALGVATFYL